MINPDTYLLNIDSKLQRIAKVMKNQYRINELIEKDNLIEIELTSKHSYNITIEHQDEKIVNISCSCTMGDQCFHKTVTCMLLKEKYSNEITVMKENSPWRNELLKLTEIVHRNSIQPPKELIDGKIVFLIEPDYFGWRLIPQQINLITGEKQRLTPTMLENIQNSCSIHEQNIIAYLLYINRFRHKNMFDYAEKIGFIMNWLKHTELYLAANAEDNDWEKLSINRDVHQLTLYMDKKGEYATFFPALFLNKNKTILKTPFRILTVDPMTILYQNTVYFVESSLNNKFWQNFQNSFRSLAIPESELNQFFREFLPSISGYIYLNKEVFPFSSVKMPLRETTVEISEVEDEIWLKLLVEYGGEKYPLVPGEKTLFLYKNNSLVLLERDIQKENELINLLYSLNLEYGMGKWSINKQVSNLEWVLNAIPELKKHKLKINGLKHLEKYKIIDKPFKFSIKIEEEKELVNLKTGIRIDNEFIPVYNLKKQLQSSRLNLFVEGLGYFKLKPEVAESLNRMLQLSVKYTPRSGFTLDKRNLWMIADIIQNLQIDSSENIKKLIAQIHEFKSITTLPQPTTLKGKLREYQKNGFAWLNFLHEFNFGGILADDMGLGKTVQILTLLTHLKEKKELHKPALIIMPTTLMENWKREIKKFSPKLKSFSYSGNKTTRLSKMQKGKFDIMLVSYGLILLDSEEIGKIDFSYLILDESQKVKNPDTKTYKAIQTVPADHRIALTGTPIENSIADLWAQMNLLMPGYLGSLPDFIKKFGEEKSTEVAFNKLRHTIQPFILRRKKEDVAPELPAKNEIDQIVEMSPKQKERYMEAAALFKEKITSTMQQKGYKAASAIILEALTYLRQIAVHPSILDHKFPLEESGKWQLLLDKIEDIIVEKHKVLIFSQYVRFLKLLKEKLEEKQIKYSYIDGQTKDRIEQVDSFQDEPNNRVFLLSLKAAGVGLNLTAADYVILMDPWWNPAVENQAIDRAHRIGQTKNIFVYRFISADTIEEKILNIQKEKLKISEAVLPEDSNLIKELDKNDILNLLI